ncbi:MAG: CHAT domain-containing protein, partial [Bacteroidota bacterium]|nr:CHAT domain-containing protein [Bacteroidota bacterium]
RNLGLHISSTFMLSKRKSQVPLNFSNWVGFAPIFFNSDQAFKLQSLLHSKDEISIIQKSLNGNEYEAISFIYDEASLNNLQLHRKSNFLHLSTHSQFNPDTDQVGLCFINNGQIRVLDYNKIIELNIQPENVYLNVCSSSSYKFYDGEGPINLNRAFLLNGANNIVFTTRRVIDTFATEFAIVFYQNLSKTQNFSISLADAKREMIKSDKYKSPIYWSNYQLIYTN